MSRIEYRDGSYYEGSVSYSDERDGYGKMHWRDGDTYEGWWRSDKMHGDGKYVESKGGKYIDEFWDFERSEKGTMYYANGEKKSGQWKNGKYLGK